MLLIMALAELLLLYLSSLGTLGLIWSGLVWCLVRAGLRRTCCGYQMGESVVTDIDPTGVRMITLQSREALPP